MRTGRARPEDPTRRHARESPRLAYWTLPAEQAARALGVELAGLTSEEARRRLARTGPNELHERPSATRLRILWRQLRSPLVLLLVFAAATSAATGAWADATLVGAILAASSGIGYQRERHAEVTIAALLARVQTTAQVVRDGREQTVPLREVVPGDVFLLAAGSIVAADGVLLEATELHVDDAVLTGESFPTVKHPGPSASDAGLRARAGCVQLGTNVRSGAARVLAVETGPRTVLGRIAGSVVQPGPETEFARGLRRFGLMLLVAMLALIVVVLTINVLLGRELLETLLFAIALAVGLSPELLPAVVGANLSHAARALARDGLLVRRLDAIENLGSMTVLCTDKTGTLTEGVVRVAGACDAHGTPSERVLELAVINAAAQSGLPNPIDAALIAGRSAPAVVKLVEVPYDFHRKRLSVVVRLGDRAVLVTKGAVEPILERCVRIAGGPPLDLAARDELAARFRAWSEDGVRVLAVATRMLATPLSRELADQERELELEGFVMLLDRAKPDAAATIAALRERGVRVKMVTGDSKYVARHIAREVGLPASSLVTGAELHRLSDPALVRAAGEIDLFAEVDPNQKERILRALARGGEVVGFFGDGVNDAPAMHAADVALSVESAVDVARATADLVLTRRGLDVIARGIEHGRATFANTLKYILTTTSANLGNMASMAVASVMLPFLPLTAGQILLNNLLSDVPAVGLATDRIDPELVARPRRWEPRLIARFMLEFGLLSSVFDGLTFAVLLAGFDAGAASFQTGWFVESLFTELVIALVVRTRRPLWRSRPGGTLLASSGAVAALAFTLPYLPLSARLGLVPLPPALALALVAIAAGYVVAAELMKSWFYRDAAP